jgi:hypothetical protein
LSPTIEPRKEVAVAGTVGMTDMVNAKPGKGGTGRDTDVSFNHKFTQILDYILCV